MVTSQKDLRTFTQSSQLTRLEKFANDVIWSCLKISNGGDGATSLSNLSHFLAILWHEVSWVSLSFSPDPTFLSSCL